MLDYQVLLMMSEGCFTCSVYDNKSNTAKLVRLRYILSQKDMKL
jgi:hypothetical protein